MAAVLGATFKMYKSFNDLSDPRTSNFPLMSSPLPVIIIVGAYLYFVNSLGPRFMKDRPAFQLDGLIKVYNVVQIVTCAYLMERGLSLAWLRNYRLFGEPVDYSNDPIAIQIAQATWLYFALKILDLLDTVFFILRKKNNQVTFLHVYHHAIMVLCCWLAVKFWAGGHATFLGTINSFVHVVMYSYYLLTSISPEYKKNVWWKKYITQIQMIQFLAILIQSIPVCLMKKPEYPRAVAGIMVVQNFFMLVLFYDFYRKAYFPKKTKTA